VVVKGATTANGKEKEKGVQRKEKRSIPGRAPASSAVRFEGRGVEAGGRVKEHFGLRR